MSKFCRSILIISRVCIVIILVSCSNNQQAEYWPTDGWRYAENKNELINNDKIKEMYDYIKLRNLEYHSIVIVRNGYIVEEKYFPHNNRPVDQDELYALFSATKSINSALVGIAISKGILEDENQRVVDFFPDYTFENISDDKRDIRIKNILTMSCGFDWDEHKFSYSDPRNIYNEWVNNEDRVKFVLDLPVKSKPGTKFNYNTGASHLIPAIIQKATGITTLEFAQKNLFQPLGIDTSDIYWPIDKKGINKGGGLNMKPLDMAKIGYLILKNGKWDGKQIIPEEWIKKSFTEAFHVGYQRGFGYHWWLYKYGDMDICAAEGYKEQRIYIIPDLGLVVVFTANILDNADNSLCIMKKYIIPAAQL